MSEATLTREQRTEIIHRAHEHYLAGRYAEAIADYDVLIQSGFTHPEVFTNRAINKQSLGDQVGAITDCDHALSERPDYTTALYTRALSHKKLGEYGAALRDIDTVLLLDSSHAEARYTKAFILGDSRDWERSIPAWTAYIAIAPSDWRGRHFRAVCYRQLGRLEEALADYTSLINEHPEMPNLWFRRSELHKLLGHEELAEKDFKQGSSLIPPGIRANKSDAH